MRTLLTAASLVLLLPIGCKRGGEGEVTDPGPSPLRRLTRTEYDTTVYQLLGDTTFPAREFTPDEEALGFDNQAAAQTVSVLLAEQYQAAAETLATRHVDRLLAMAPGCADDEASRCDAAAADFVEQLGTRAFRRPLEPDEIERYATLFRTGTTLGEGSYDGSAGVSLVAEAMLQSPSFLYRVELGQPGEPGEPVPLTSYELANRLSYTLWGGMPDDALFEKAASDELQDPEVLQAEARRLLSLPRARDASRNFFGQWLSLDDIETYVGAAGRDLDLYPDYRPPLLPLFERETSLFTEYVVFDSGEPIDTLFTADYSIMNRELAEFYGLDAEGMTEQFVRVDLDPSIYSGILTQAGLLALHAKPDRSSPVHRGHWVRESLLCQIPPPPPDIVPEPPEVDENSTTRDQFEQHVSDPSCQGCHRLMDPIGFGFENFDALGRYRATQGGQPIDASGEVTNTLDANGVFDGVDELGQKLGGSVQVRDCVSTQWFRFAFGRSDDEEVDAPHLEAMRKDFADNGYSMLELMVATTQTDAFRYRRALESAE